MRLRDSGMPDEPYWESLFDVRAIVSALGINAASNVAELGCGYGTFTLPVAQAISGKLYTFDIDPAMIARTEERLRLAGISNVVCQHRDVMEFGFGLPAIDAVLLFNILHCDDPHRLLNHASDAVRPGGWLFVIHWRFDPRTPRGPSLDIRPKPEQIIEWAEQTGWIQHGGVIDLPPWHYGLRFTHVSRGSSAGSR